jgi:hypothetical protein
MVIAETCPSPGLVTEQLSVGQHAGELPGELLTRSGEQAVQPVEGGSPEDDGRHTFAVAFRAFGLGEQAGTP